MCGILGGNNRKWKYDQAIACMNHRGPDATRISALGDITLAFARLSIMDLSERAMQPMDSEDGRVHIVFNGEIYGFQSLRSDLEKHHRFCTTSDTEVLLNAYLEYGDDFIEHIDGMFGIAIYDERDSIIRLYRDRVGIKPLYYYICGDEFAFSSELKGITQLIGRQNLKVDDTAIYDFLNYQYIPSPKSLYQNVYKLEPGCFIRYDVHKRRLISDGRYWKLEVNSSSAYTGSQDEISAELRRLISAEISKQMVADVPVGTFLSGGVDSSIVTYEASRVKPDVCAFSIGFKDSVFDESRYAQMLTDKYSLNCVTKVLGSEDIENSKGSLRDWYDEPFADTSAYPTFLVSQLARSRVTVVLTGDGGDELFAGYDRYERFLMRRQPLKRIGTVTKRIIKLMLRYGLKPNDISELWESDFTIYRNEMGMPVVYPNVSVEEFAQKLDIPKGYDKSWAFRRYWIEDLPPLTRLKYLDFMTYLPEDVLTKVDRASMQVSLECRVPLLSRDIVEYAFSLSEQDCCPQNMLKGCLKKAYEGIIPDEILYRPKMGFAVPYGYLRDEWDSGHVWLGVLQREWGELVS